MSQYRLHERAGLTTPFFVGQYVQLPLSCGAVDAIFIAADITSTPLYMGHHPTRGLSSAPLGVDLDVDVLWSLPSTSRYDIPLGYAQFFPTSRMLRQAFQTGGYSFPQFLHDVRTRDGFKAGP